MRFGGSLSFLDGLCEIFQSGGGRRRKSQAVGDCTANGHLTQFDGYFGPDPPPAWSTSGFDQGEKLQRGYSNGNFSNGYTAWKTGASSGVLRATLHGVGKATIHYGDCHAER